MAEPTDDPGRTAPFSASAPQILATEHWSLLATRSMGWNESFSRTGVFLNVLSAAVVALALVADATRFGEGFFLFAIVLFPMVLFLGLATFVRLMQINMEDGIQVVAMNRLRHAYMRIAPELEPYFTTGWHDDEQSMFQTFTLGMPPNKTWQQFFITTPTVIATIDSIIAAAGMALFASRGGVAGAGLVVIALAAFAVVWAALFALQLRAVGQFHRAYVGRFPTPAVMTEEQSRTAQARPPRP